MTALRKPQSAMLSQTFAVLVDVLLLSDQHGVVFLVKLQLQHLCQKEVVPSVGLWLTL